MGMEFQESLPPCVEERTSIKLDKLPTRFLNGSAREPNQILQASRFREVRGEIFIVQPGLSQACHSAKQTVVLASAHCFLNDTVDIPLDVICSA